MIKIGLLKGMDLYLLLFSVLIFILCFAWSVFLFVVWLFRFGYGMDEVMMYWLLWFFFYGWGNRWLVVMIYENEWDDDIGGRDYFVKNEWGDWW